MQVIQELGGSFAQTDVHGNFELKLLKDNKKKRFYLFAVGGRSVRKRNIDDAERGEDGQLFCPWFQ